LGHADVTMTNKYYVHVAKEERDEQIGKYAPSFGIKLKTTVVPLHKKGAA
jgi:integrase